MRVRIDLRLALALGWLAFPAIIAYFGGARSSHVLANALLLIAFAPALVALHVGAYVAAGRLAGVTLLQFRVGRGRPFLVGSAGAIAFSAAPVTAGVRADFALSSTRFARLRLAAVRLAALGVDAIVVALLLRFAGARFDLASFGDAVTPANALLVASAWHGIWNLYPLLRGNDAHAILSTPLLDRAHLVELTEIQLAARVVELMEERRFDDAEGLVRHARAQRDSASLRCLEANLLAERGDHAGAAERYRALLAEAPTPWTRLRLEHDLAWSLLHLPDARADEALPLAERVWRRFRDDAGAQCTLGAANVVAGRHHDGVALCEMAYFDAVRRLDAGRAAAWAAHAHARAGNLERATMWRDVAARHAPQSTSFALAELALAEAQGAATVRGTLGG